MTDKIEPPDWKRYFAGLGTDLRVAPGDILWEGVAAGAGCDILGAELGSPVEGLAGRAARIGQCMAGRVSGDRAAGGGGSPPTSITTTATTDDDEQLRQR